MDFPVKPDNDYVLKYLLAGLRRIKRCHDSVLDKALEHFEFIGIEPGEAAVTAAVDFDEICKTVKCPHHWVMALSTPEERRRHVPCPL